MEIYLLIALAGSLIERQPGATPDEDGQDESLPAAAVE
jgi:hypothetical protein